ncbi:MAG: ABC transporter ATP-binding protein [Acidimicrobiia bacterium]
MPSDPRPHPLRRLVDYASPHRGRMRTATIWSVLNKLFDLAPPFLIGAAIDVVIAGDSGLMSRWLSTFGFDTSRQQLVALVVISAIIWGLESAFEYAFKVGWRTLAQTVQHDLRQDAYASLQQLDQAYFEDRASGDLMTVLNDDVNQLERFLDVGANELLQLATTVLVIGGGFLIIDPSVAWVAFLPIPLILWGSFRFQRRLEPLYATVRERASDVSALLANNLGGITIIKAFTGERREAARLEQVSEDYRTANEAAIRWSSAFTPLIRIAILVGFLATLALGGLRALDGAISPGTYAMMMYLVQRLLWPLTRLGETMDLYQRAMASTNRALDLVDARPRIVGGSTRLDEVAGDVGFHGVRFAYGDGPEVLHGIDITARAGDEIAIVGPTGSGKSTIVKLLLRLYDPSGGRITLDGVPISDLPLDHLRSHLGLVSQDVFLFQGSVAENIAYGRPDATPEQVEAAARIAEAHDFITGLSNGYDTLVGERGQKLSGGQRQRISIARAILADPEVLVLDEATSAVDNETEAAIQRSLGRITADRTTIVIAHRLSTIRNADRIYVVDGGRVTEEGTHDELVATGGVYADLWAVQTGELVGMGGEGPLP